MELQGERLIPASLDKTWASLNDPEVLKACIAGCESLERTGENTLTAVVALKVGPVSARFKGNLAMTNVQAPTAYTINFDGQGGVAGFGKGSADVALTAEGPESTRLNYLARATVGGKMAQIGSRLIDATAGKITDDFFKAFEAHLQASATPVAAATSAASSGAAGTSAVDAPVKTAGLAIDGEVATMAVRQEAAHDAAAASTSPAAPRTTLGTPTGAPTGTEPAADTGVQKVWWLIGAVVVAAVIYFAIR